MSIKYRKEVKARAAAKINLTFEIKSLRSDNYHEVETLMQSVDLFDHVRIKVNESSTQNIRLRSYQSNVPGIFPMDESNLAVKAVKLFFEEAGFDSTFNIDIDVNKSIPIQAGLAGGSADAAASLLAINHAFYETFSLSKLLELGSQLGADVPFCIKGGTCVGTEKGDKLEYLKETDTKIYMVLVKPVNLAISTPALFNTYDEQILNKQGKTDAGITKIARKAYLETNLSGLYQSFSNDFEQVFFRLHPEMLQLKERLIELGCWTVNLTGSGPTLFGTTANLERANWISRMLVAEKMNYPQREFFKNGPLHTYSVRTISDSAKILSYEKAS